MPLDAILPRLILQALMRQPIVLPHRAPPRLQPLHVDDLTAAIAHELAKPAERVSFDLASGVQLTVRDAAALVSAAVRPATVVDGTGHIRYRHVGPLTAADVTNKMLPLIERITAPQ